MLPEAEIAPHISYSRLQTFNKCSFQYMFKYEMDLQQPGNLNMSRGKAGHKALELNALHKIETGQDQTVEQVHDNFKTAFDEEISDIVLLEWDKPDEQADNTRALLTKYMAEEAPLVTPMHVELELWIPVPDIGGVQVPPILGYADAVNLRNSIMYDISVENIELVDRKFPGKKPSSVQDVVNMSDQLTIYDKGLRDMNIVVNDMVIENYVPPTKTIGPRLERDYRAEELLNLPAREERTERVFFKARQFQRAVVAGDRYTPIDDPRVCGQCPYRQMCQFSLVKSDYEAEKFDAETFHILPD